MTRNRTLTIGAAMAVAMSLGVCIAPAGAQNRPYEQRHEEREHHENWHRGYRPPPVVYARPVYYPPPIVYGPGSGIFLPPIVLEIH